MTASDLKLERSKLEFGLCCLHSALVACEIKQVDYDLQYFGLCFAMARIDKSLHELKRLGVVGGV